MEKQLPVPRKFVTAISWVLILLGLYLASLYNYLLFHSLAEIFSIVVACGIFMVAWNSRSFLDNTYLLFIGIAYLFIGGLDLVHTLAYKGMNIFQGYETNLPTQLWIASRYMECLSLLIAPLLLGRKLKINVVFIAYAMGVFFLLASVFYLQIFPVCFIEGVGLTPFKKISEYIISLILLASVYLMVRRREEFDRGVLQLLVASIIVTIGSELAFIFYVHAYGFSNLVGHYFKIISFYLIYKAIIETGLAKPYDLLFRNLKQSEETLKKAHNELEEKALALEEVNLKVQEADRLKSIFLASMSHELRTPLNSIIGFTGILLKGFPGHLNDEQAKQLSMVQGSAQHLLCLINDILDISKIEAGQLEVLRKRFYLPQAIEKVIHAMKPLAEKKGLTLITSVAQDVAYVVSDQRRVEQILINLLNNAVKFTEKGEVFLECNIHDDRVALRVQDTGIGLNPEDFEKVFEAFSQIEMGLTRHYEGTGLGLSICKKLAGLLGGEIWAESEGAGKGSVFTFTLPIGGDGDEE